MGDVVSALINALNEYGKTTRDINTIVLQKGNYKVKIWITSIDIASETIFLTVDSSEVFYKYRGKWICLSKSSIKSSNTIATIKDGKLVETGGILEIAKDINEHVNTEKLLNGNRK